MAFCSQCPAINIPFPWQMHAQVDTDLKAGTTTLTIIGVTSEEAGEYRCTASNEHGQAETKCRLVVEGS